MAVRGTKKLLVTRRFLVVMAVLAAIVVADALCQAYRFEHVRIVDEDGNVREYRQVSAETKGNNIMFFNRWERQHVFEEKNGGGQILVIYRNDQGYPELRTENYRLAEAFIRGQWFEKGFIRRPPGDALLTGAMSIDNGQWIIDNLGTRGGDSSGNFCRKVLEYIWRRAGAL